MSKTKDQILSTKHWNEEYPNYMQESEIHDAMDEYAEEMVGSNARALVNIIVGECDIPEFIDQPITVGEIRDVINLRIKQQIISYEIWLEAELNNDSSFNYEKTPEQLYDLFQSQQNKQS